MKRFACSAVAALLVGVVSVANAAPVHWTFGPFDFSNPGNGFSFVSGEGTLSGSFLYDAETNAFDDVTFVGVGTDTADDFDRTFFATFSNAVNIRFSDIESGNQTGGLAVAMTFRDPLTDAGGTARLQSLILGICGNGSCNSIGGQEFLLASNAPVDGFEATGTPVPLPAGLVLMLTGLGGIGLAARRG